MLILLNHYFLNVIWLSVWMFTFWKSLNVQLNIMKIFKSTITLHAPSQNNNLLETWHLWSDKCNRLLLCSAWKQLLWKLLLCLIVELFPHIFPPQQNVPWLSREHREFRNAGRMRLVLSPVCGNQPFHFTTVKTLFFLCLNYTLYHSWLNVWPQCTYSTFPKHDWIIFL